MYRSGQLQEQGFSVEVAERIAANQRSSARTIYISKWALFERWYRENLADFSTPTVKQVSVFFMYLYQDLNRHPSTIEVTGWPLLTPWAQRGYKFLKALTLIGYFLVFTGIVPKVPGISQSGTFLLCLMSSQKHPLSLWNT